MRRPLSFAIPTYGRPAELRMLLEHLCPQAASHDLRIYISDNGSPPGTEEVIQRFKRHYPNVRSARHVKNLGFEANVLSALGMASESRYVWLLSDDDLVLPGAVPKLLRRIEEDRDSVSLYLTNWQRRDASMKATLRERFFELAADEVLDHRQLFLKYGLAELRFMSCLIYQSDRLSGAMARARCGASSRLSGENWGFVYQRLALDVAFASRARIINEPLLAQRIGRPYYVGRDCEVFLLEFPRMLAMLPQEQYPMADSRRVLLGGHRFEPKFLPTVLRAVADGSLSRRRLLDMASVYSRLGISERAQISMALAATPLFAWRILYRMWRKRPRL